MTPRKCYECDSVMRLERKNYKYNECGLPNVVLADIGVYVCDQCGSQTPEIVSVAGLHRAIMLEILRKKTLLCGEEIRFLRKMARMTAAELAKFIGADSTTVSKWENNRTKIGAKADRVLRLVCYTGMLERMVKSAAATAKDENLTGAVATAAMNVESLDIRDLFTKIENRQSGPKRVTIPSESISRFSDSIDGRVATNAVQ